jgi:hypothetical protein
MIDVAETPPVRTVPKKTPMLTSPAQSGWTGPGPGPQPVASPTPEELQAASDAQYNYRNSLLTPAAPATPATPATPPAPPAPPTDATPVFSPKNDARNTIKAVLASYGLDALSDVLWSNYSSGFVDVTNPQALIYSIRNEPAYKERFKANDVRVKAGLPELSPSEYIGLEDQYKQVARSNGLPMGFYDTPDDITKLISGDVSPSEFQSRITNGYNAVANADPEVVRQFREIYNVSEGQLVSYFLDPARGEPLLKQQAQAAKIAARGLESGGIQLTRSTAEDLAARGITEAEAQAGFGNIAKLGELTTARAGEAGLTSEQIIGSQFGIDTQATLELERRKRLRLGEFAGGGSFARTQGETSGSISTSVGKAQ